MTNPLEPFVVINARLSLVLHEFTIMMYLRFSDEDCDTSTYSKTPFLVQSEIARSMVLLVLLTNEVTHF